MSGQGDLRDYRAADLFTCPVDAVLFYLVLTIMFYILYVRMYGCAYAYVCLSAGLCVSVWAEI